MAQGGAAAAGPAWGWAGEGDDWALTLLALAVVAATALALHWLGSSQDPETLGPAPRAGGAGAALLPKAKVGGGSEERGSGRGGAGVAGPAQAASGAQDPAAPGAPPLETPGEAACGGPLGQQHGRTAEAPPGEGREPQRPGSSRAGGMPAPLLIHFTPRSPGGEGEARVTAGGARAKASVPQGAAGHDISPWTQGWGPPSSLGRGPGSPWQVNHSSGHGACRPLKPDPLRLGTVVSVWDAVDAASGLWAAPPGPSAPQKPLLQPAAQAGPLVDSAEGTLGKGRSQTAPVLALGSRANAGKSGETGPPAPRESRGSPGPTEGWPWAEREGLITRRVSQASGSMRPWPEAPQWGRTPLSSGQEPMGGGAGGSAGRGATEERGGHGTPEGGGAGQGQGDLRGRAAGQPVSGPRGDTGSQRSPGPPCPQAPEARWPLGSLSPSGALSAAPTFPAPSPSDSPPSQAAALDGSVRSAPLTAQALDTALASGSRPASQGPQVTLCKGAQVSTSWGNLILMVLRSHPFPRREPTQGRAPWPNADRPRGPGRSAPSGSRRPGAPPEGAAPRGSAGGCAGADAGGLAEAAPQQHGGSPAAKAPGPSSGPRGEGTQEGCQGAPLLPAAPPRAPSLLREPTAPSPAKGDSQPIPLPRKRSLLEAAESAQPGSGAAPEPSPGERGPSEQSPPEQSPPERSPPERGPSEQSPPERSPPGQNPPEQEPGERSPGERSPAAAPEARPRPARPGARPPEQQPEARKLLAFLQRPGTWGAAAAAAPRRLDLGSCPDVLAVAQRLGEPGPARDAYALLSDNLLRVLGAPGLYRQLSGAERERILSLRTRRGRAVLGVLALPSLYQPGRPAPSGGPPGPRPPRTHLHVFDPRENSWRPLTPVPEEAALRGCGLCTMHNYLFLAGGVRGSGAGAVCSNRVFCYNPLTDLWSQLRPMQQARAQLKLVALDGLLYAIGGECLYSVERYDPRADAWSARAPLPAGTFPVAHEAVACRGDIYVTGGHLFYRLLRYSPKKDAWDERPYSASHRRCSDMVALGGFLYRFDLLRGVGVAVTRYNTVTGSWSRAASLPLPHALPLRCAVLGDTIYCLNHQVTATFVVSEGMAQFQAKELQPFPPGSKGVLCPFALTLPAADALQTAL